MAATIRDVANLSGYSVGTISKYINGQPVKEATKIAIEHAIQQSYNHCHQVLLL